MQTCTYKYYVDIHRLRPGSFKVLAPKESLHFPSFYFLSFLQSSFPFLFFFPSSFALFPYSLNLLFLFSFNHIPSFLPFFIFPIFFVSCFSFSLYSFHSFYTLPFLFFCLFFFFIGRYIWEQVFKNVPSTTITFLVVCDTAEWKYFLEYLFSYVEYEIDIFNLR